MLVFWVHSHVLFQGFKGTAQKNLKRRQLTVVKHILFFFWGGGIFILFSKDSARQKKNLKRRRLPAAKQILLTGGETSFGGIRKRCLVVKVCFRRGPLKEKLKGNNQRPKLSGHFFTLYGTSPHFHQFFSEFFLQDFFVELSSFTTVLVQRDEKRPKDQTILHVSCCTFVVL